MHHWQNTNVWDAQCTAEASLKGQNGAVSILEFWIPLENTKTFQVYVSFESQLWDMGLLQIATAVN